MGRKKCCVCGGTKKKSFHKVRDMVELKSYLEVTNGSKYVCDGCRLKKNQIKQNAINNIEVCFNFFSNAPLFLENPPL